MKYLKLLILSFSGKSAVFRGISSQACVIFPQFTQLKSVLYSQPSRVISFVQRNCIKFQGPFHDWRATLKNIFLFLIQYFSSYWVLVLLWDKIHKDRDKVSLWVPVGKARSTTAWFCIDPTPPSEYSSFSSPHLRLICPQSYFLNRHNN